MKLSLILCTFLFPILLCAQSDSNKINLWATYYYIPVVSHDLWGVDLLDENEVKTGFRLTNCDWCKASMEGTVLIMKDSQTVLFNYAGRSKRIQSDCRKCDRYRNYDGFEKTGSVLWKQSSGYGKGTKNYNLVPFKTIAVDPSFIPVGSVLFVPAAKGVQYVNEQGETAVHDGYFFAGDVGSKIKGNHIDVFLGMSNNNPFSFINSDKNKPFDAFRVSDQLVIEVIRKMHL